jgi:hypothetical protein
MASSHFFAPVLAIDPGDDTIAVGDGAIAGRDQVEGACVGDPIRHGGDFFPIARTNYS